MFFGTPSLGLGIDIGTTSIKMVKLQKIGQGFELKNYVEYRSKSLEQKPLLIESTSFFLFRDNLSNSIKKVLMKANIKEREASISLPVFSSFFTVVEFPLMPFEEIPGAVKFQAQQYIPVPLSEVILDWQIIEEESTLKNRMKILLVAVPKDIVEKYSKLAKDINFKLKTLEIESFALARSLTKEEGAFVILDIGGGATSLTIVDRGVIRVSHSLDFFGFTLTRALSQRFDISLERAEELKREKGVRKNVENLVFSVISPILDKIIFAVEREINTYHFSNPGKEIKKIILAGGGSLLPGLTEYISQKLQRKVEIGNPFKDIIYPPILEKGIEEVGPIFSNAVGLAMRGLQE